MAEALESNEATRWPGRFRMAASAGRCPAGDCGAFCLASAERRGDSRRQRFVRHHGRPDADGSARCRQGLHRRRESSRGPETSSKRVVPPGSQGDGMVEGWAGFPRLSGEESPGARTLADRVRTAWRDRLPVGRDADRYPPAGRPGTADEDRNGRARGDALKGLGDRDGAWRWYRAMFRFSRLVGRNAC